ncbi:hypothetical protein ACWDTD_04450 [Gordonia sp. NPDC003425]
MASPQVASSRTTEAPVRVHVWRILSMLAALVLVIVGLLIILTSAA